MGWPKLLLPTFWLRNQRWLFPFFEISRFSIKSPYIIPHSSNSQHPLLPQIKPSSTQRPQTSQHLPQRTLANQTDRLRYSCQDQWRQRIMLSECPFRHLLDLCSLWPLIYLRQLVSNVKENDEHWPWQKNNIWWYRWIWILCLSRDDWEERILLRKRFVGSWSNRLPNVHRWATFQR